MKQGMYALKGDVRGGGVGDGDVVPAPASSAGSKKAKKGTLEKHLEEINKELQGKSSGGASSGSSNGKQGTKKLRMKPEQEIVLLEQKCVLLLKLKRHKDVIDDGYSVIGRMGPNTVIYKCILIALARLGKPEDDIIELLESWRKATPKCPHMLETKRKFDGYLTALRSGVKHSDIFSSIEDALSLNAEAVLSKQLTDIEENKWRFRAPPPRHTTFSICPRSGPSSSGNNSCIYGEECLFAHSKEELKEWKIRLDGDKKENNALDDAVESCNHSSKKRPIPNIYRSLSIPPLCIHYLLDLGKKLKETANIKEILADDLPGVKFKLGTPLHYQKKVNGYSKTLCTWSFMVGSKMPLGTVSILHDANRECFRISSGLYYNKKKESISLIELHPNNKVQSKLQVLNTFIQPSLFLRFNYGWPEMCYYKVEVMFESRDPFPEPGLYRQSIVFDFKKDPKLVKHICVEILPQADQLESAPLLPAVNIGKSVWAYTPAADIVNVELSPKEPLMSRVLNNSYQMEVGDFSSKNSDFPRLLDQFGSGNVNKNSSNQIKSKCVGNKLLDVVDSESGVMINLEGVSLFSSFEPSSENNLFLSDVPLTKENYCAWMRDFLSAEVLAKQKALNNLRRTVDLNLFEKHSKSPNPEHLYQYTCNDDGSMYGKLELLSDISCDTKLGKLINEHCNAVLICRPADPTTSYKKMYQRYFCRIVDKLKSAVIISVGKKAVSDLLLMPNSVRQLQVQFVLDQVSIDRLKQTLEKISNCHMDILFPNFEDMQVPFLKVVDSVGMLNEEELVLNSRQLSVYNLLIGRKVLLDGDTLAPSILITGPVSTGKTHLLAHGLRGLLRFPLGVQVNRILVCTQSDLSADRYITEYLHPWLINDEISVQRSKPLRIYGTDKFVDAVSGAVKHYCLFNNDGTKFRYPSKEEVLSHRIIITTLSTCAELIQLDLEDDTFSHILIDEAAQCLEVECIQPVVLAGKYTKLILAGDVMQTHLGMFAISKGVPPISLIERLRNLYPFRHPFVVNLLENYTNHEVIVKFVSEMFYNDQLRSASIQPCHPQHYPLSFQHVPTSRELQADNGGGYYNMEEIRHIVEFTDELVQSWPETWGNAESKDSVVVVTPYTNHITGLKVQLQLKGLQSVNVEMVSNIIGKRFRVVIISTVRTLKNNEENSLSSSYEYGRNGGFFSDRRLINAAISCAKSLVVVFGDALSLWSNGNCRDVWRKFMAECHTHKSIRGLPQDGTKFEESGVVFGGPVSTDLLKPLSLFRADTKIPTHLPMLQSPPLETRTPGLFGSDIVARRRIPEVINPPITSTSTTVNNINSNTSWSVPSTALHQPPKTDLFSAFNSNLESLYDGSHSAMVEQRQEPKSVVLGPIGVKNKMLDLEMPSCIFKPEVYKNPNPVELGSITPGFSCVNNFNRIANSENLNIEIGVGFMSPFSPRPFASPPVLAQVPFDRGFLVGEPNPAPPPPQIPDEAPFGFDSVETSPQKFISPLMRGPPGFSPVIGFEPKLNNFSPTENKTSHPLSPLRGSGSAVSSHKYGYKRNSYELPPRMLRNLHLTNRKSPTIRKPAPSKIHQAEMNFFEELGLGSQPGKEMSCSASSTSSDNSFIDTEDTMCIVEEDYSDSPLQSEWIEVKNSRKGKNQPMKKVKPRTFAEEPFANEVISLPTESSSGYSSEMSVEDKIELITQMGFTKAQAIKALQTSDRDLQQAVDYLITKSTS